MNKVSLKIWGREFSLSVKYDVLDDEKITAQQEDSLKKIVNGGELRGEDDVIRYCTRMNPEAVDKNASNVFKYVIPRSILVCREKNQVAILCDYKYDLDNGIAVLYENGKLKKVGTQDLVL